jgi:hypothetical protein
MSKVVFSGCSFTAGTGWNTTDIKADDKDHPELWVNLACNQIPILKNLDVVNVGQSGASNTEIFKNTVKVIAELGSDIDMFFCQWTSMPRYSFDVGLETWATPEGLSRTARSKFDINLSDGTTYSRKYLDDLLDRLLVLHHLHGEILKVVEYSNILQKLSKKFNITLYFINGLCPWDNNYFVKLQNAMPEDFTPFTKKEILAIESKNDADIFKLYTLIHNKYNQAGGIDPAQWINLYSSMSANKIDVNYDKNHPGTQSNQLYFEQIKKFLETQ